MKTIRLEADVYAALVERAREDRRTLQDYVHLVLAEHCRLLPPGVSRAGELSAGVRSERLRSGPMSRAMAVPKTVSSR